MEFFDRFGDIITNFFRSVSMLIKPLIERPFHLRDLHLHFSHFSCGFTMSLVCLSISAFGFPLGILIGSRFNLFVCGVFIGENIY